MSPRTPPASPEDVRLPLGVPGESPAIRPTAWELLPAVRGTGLWLVGAGPLGVVAFAPPGVELARGEPTTALNRWRHGCWSSSAAGAGIETVPPEIEPLKLVEVLEMIPANWQPWIRDVTRAHLRHLARFAEPEVGAPLDEDLVHEVRQLIAALREDARAAFPGEDWHRADSARSAPPADAYGVGDLAGWDDDVAD